MNVQRIPFTIHLTGDAEPGCGIGSEIINDFVPRTADGHPCLQASHLRGLIRQNLYDLEEHHQWPGLSDIVLGAPGIDGSAGHAGAIHFTDAAAETNSTALVSRTAINQWGTARETSLRTVELIPAGTQLRGHLTIEATPGSVIDLAARLALLMISNVGGNRTRGAGACWIGIEGENRTPGSLLKELEKAIGKSGIPLPPSTFQKTNPKEFSGKYQWVRLVFHAKSPLCCPETPTIGINVVRSGFSIPASAVIGALLTRIDKIDPSLASACFDSLCENKTRVFPLLPVASADAQDDPQKLPAAVRVSMTHRMSKLPNSQGEHDFRDEAIEPYDWRDVAAGSPLKASDGVLLTGGAFNECKLWQSKDMPRVIHTHGVHRDPMGKRNLFTVESMAPMVFSGWAFLPQEAIDVFQNSLKSNPYVVMGRSRGVLGDGILSITSVQASEILQHTYRNSQVWVVQSPIAIPENADYLSGNEPAEEILKKMAQAAGLPVASDTWAKAGVQFGWNRHGLGIPAHAGHQRLKARRCILPGSVLVFSQPVQDPENFLIRGLGKGAENGFGALLPHPGLASAIFRPAPSNVTLKSRNNAAKEAWKLWQESGTGGPTPSQIAHLAGKLRAGEALKWLKKQKEERPARIWDRWSPVYDILEKLLQDPAKAASVLRIWQDLVIANREDAQKGGRP